MKHHLTLTLVALVFMGPVACGDSVSLRVINGKTGQPLEGVTVRLTKMMARVFGGSSQSEDLVGNTRRDGSIIATHVPTDTINYFDLSKPGFFDARVHWAHNPFGSEAGVSIQSPAGSFFDGTGVYTTAGDIRPDDVVIVRMLEHSDDGDEKGEGGKGGTHH